MINDLWYKNAIIYCLSVGTYMDANADGIGDFPGLMRRLDYLHGLGITAIWLMPFQSSPCRDDGYDVSDYYNVDSRYGTLGDFVEFAHAAKQRGIRVIIDLVVNHTSDQHPWFKEARKDPTSKYRDWYIWSKKNLAPATVNRQIGRILQQNQRSAGRFAITLESDGCPAGFRLGFVYNDAFDNWADLSEGAYLLRSNITDWSDQQLWKAYIQLTQAEAAFRIQKDQLNVRPIWHQREDRVQAHILVCFLAFVLWKSLEMWQSRAGLGNSPRTILEELKRIQSQDVVLPTAAPGQIRLRCVTQPDPAQAALLNRLGIVLPKRMRLAEQDLPALEHSA